MSGPAVARIALRPGKVYAYDWYLNIRLSGNGGGARRALAPRTVYSQWAATMRLGLGGKKVLFGLRVCCGQGFGLL